MSASRALAILVSSVAWVATRSAAADPPKGLTLQPGSGTLHAFVLGNERYDRAPLANPGRDANAVADTLRALGFSVTLEKDVQLRKMERAIDDYVATLRNGDISVVYYSGHGVQVEGENYLVPVDFAATDEADVKYAAYALERLLDKLAAHAPVLNVVILDACRDNPYRSSRSGSRGLAGVSAAQGTLIAFATSPGRTAADGVPGEHGVYTGALLRALDREGVDIDEMFKQVREDVATRTKNEQVPWSSSSVTGRFCLKGSCVATKGTLSVITNPAGAHVLLAGREIGQSPVRRELEHGPYELRLTMDGFRDTARTVLVEAGKDAVVLENLTALFGALRVETSPPGATILVDGARVGSSPVRLDLPGGSHAVELDLKGYGSVVRAIMVQPGKEMVLNERLSASLGSIRIATIPEGARVLLDGKEYGPVTVIPAVEPGRHSLQLQMDHFEETVEQVMVAPEREATIVKRLVPRFGTVGVETQIPGVSVTMNGEPIGRTPIIARRVDPGDYEVQVDEPCWRPVAQPVTVKAGDARIISLALAPREASLKVTAFDEDGELTGARVFVDDVEAGNAPKTFRVSLCASKVAVVRPDGARWMKTVQLRESRVTVLRADFTGTRVPEPPAVVLAPPKPPSATTEAAQHPAAPSPVPALSLPPVAGRAPPGAPLATAPPPPMSTRRKIGISGLAAGAAALIAGVVLGVNSLVETNSLRTQARPAAQGQALISSVNAGYTAADVLFGAGGAVAATGLGLVVAF